MFQMKKKKNVGSYAAEPKAQNWYSFYDLTHPFPNDEWVDEHSSFVSLCDASRFQRGGKLTFLSSD